MPKTTAKSVAKKAPKKTAKHPGVVLLKPDPERRIGWRARFTDPDTGRMKKVVIPEEDAGTLEKRVDWAVGQSKKLAARRHALEGGAVRASGVPLADAVERYFVDHSRLKASTRDVYRGAATRFLGWGATHRVRTTDDLTRPKLLRFRAWLAAEPKQVASSTGKRGARRKGAEVRSPASVNVDLRAVRTVLGYLRQLELLPHLSDESRLREGLKQYAVPVERTEYMRASEIRKLLEAALRHDAATVRTREEEQALRVEAKRRGITRQAMGELCPQGTSPRYTAIAPFVLFVLLSGVRFSEALALTWRHVDLDALDNTGARVGEALIRASKTGQDRTLDFAVSPVLRALLAALRLSQGPAAKPGARVFPMTRNTAESAAKRLLKEYGAPMGFGWQMLRRTCGTYLTNAPGIFAAASAYRSAQQLGHSVEVAEKHYLGLVRGIPLDARDLETAMQVNELAAQVVAGVRGGPSHTREVVHLTRSLARGTL